MRIGHAFQSYLPRLILLFLSALPAAWSEEKSAQELPSNLTEIGLEALLSFDLVVTSPGKKEQTVSDVASAIFVLTREDIQRSGVQHIAEALRLVPGVSVARVSSSQWAVSIRGFNQVYANKLLVLVDGISVFSPLTNGVYWETLDLLLDDIERIEVIRGPGAALWGSNAVNGVVNIITRHAKDTTGGFVTAGGGTSDRILGTARYGGAIGNDTFARVSGKFSQIGENDLRDGSSADDDWNIGSFDTRVDSKLESGAAITFLGHAFSERDDVRPQTPILQPPFVDEQTFAGRGKWQGGFTGLDYRQEFSPTSKLNVIGSASFQERDSELISLNYGVYELDVTHQASPFTGHDFVYGGSYRLFDNSTDGSYAQDTVPEDRTMERVNWFIQDEIALDDKWHLILGSKFERNTSTDFEYMPNARLLWTPNKSNTVWAAVSRAVAPPALVFEDTVFPVAAIPPGEEGAPGTLVEVFGDRDVASETVLAYELGYRTELTSSFSIDVAGFYNQYDNVLSQEPGEPFFDVPNESSEPAVIVPLRFANGYRATSIGGELAIEWKAQEWWRMKSSYSYFSARAESGESLDEQNQVFIEGSSPKHSATLRSSFDIGESVDFDLTGRYVDSLALGGVGDYIELDSALSWTVTQSTSIGLYGQNLLDQSHLEYVGNLFGPPPIEIRRAFFGTITVRF